MRSLVLLLSVLAACGGTAVVDEAIGNDGGTDSGVDAREITDAAGDANDADDAVADSGADRVISCGDDATKTSTQCEIARECTERECAGGFLYVCHYGGAEEGKRPPIARCARAVEANPIPGAESWCCPPACVPDTRADSACDGGHFFACAQGASFAPGCRRIGAVPSGDGFCCP